MRLNTPLPFYIAFGTVALVLLGELLLSFSGYSITKNLSVSAPRGLYLLQAPQSLKRNELVIFPLPQNLFHFAERTTWLNPENPLLKRVGAIAGDRVCRRARTLFINETITVRAKEKDTEGIELPKWSGCFKVRRGYFLPISTYSPNSFDGRYFGAVPLSAIRGKAYPIFTF